MRGAFLTQHGGTEVLQIGEVEKPKLSDDSILVNLKYSSINHLDIWVRKGIPGLKLKYPHILGGDGAGYIAELGNKVTGFKEGDEVVIFPGLSCGACQACQKGNDNLCVDYKILGEHICGTNAEFVSLPKENIFLKPENISMQDASSFALVYITAWQMLVNKAKVKKGDSVLIHSAGSGVSMALISIAKKFGAEIIVTSRSANKLKSAEKMGATHTIHTEQKDFLAEVRKITKSGVDIICDHLGMIFWEKNIKALRAGGVLVTCGATTGFEAKTDLRHVFYRQLQILGSTMGSKKDFPEILNGFSNGDFTTMVDSVYSLTDIQKAHSKVEKGEQIGKVVLSIKA